MILSYVQEQIYLSLPYVHTVWPVFNSEKVWWNFSPYFYYYYTSKSSSRSLLPRHSFYKTGWKYGQWCYLSSACLYDMLFK